MAKVWTTELKSPKIRANVVEGYETLQDMMPTKTIMRKNLITISDNDSVYVLTNVQVKDFEIAELFGVMMPTLKSNIRAILKIGVITEDTTNGTTLVSCNILPDYFGLDTVLVEK